jgi:uncharacterized protein YkwD
MPLPRKLLLTTIALVALALPATAHAGYTAKRVANAHLSSGRHTHAAPIARVARQHEQPPADCPNADMVPDAGSLDAFRAAIACLHNQIRGANGLPLLHLNGKLRTAAEGHSAEMVRGRYFDHTSPSGSTMVGRILASGYVRPDRGWLLGENLEWGTGSMATPRGALDAWMNSPGHRANVLKRGYRQLGVGVVLGTPTGMDGGVTITVDFGARR